jgi:hypothetical protein
MIRATETPGNQTRTPSHANREMIETEIKVTPQIAAEHGLTPDEYARIQKILARAPSLTELGIFSVMWSEHCSYKSSRVHLKRLPTRGTHVVQGPGENAGVVDIGDGLVAVFKIESHNHPSFVEPFQGAATGVGGILRDIFTMGARPIAVLDSLRFGPITSGVKTPEGSAALTAGLKPRPSEEKLGTLPSTEKLQSNSRSLTPIREERGWVRDDSSHLGGFGVGARAALEAQREEQDAGLKPGATYKLDSAQNVTAEEIARNLRILDGVVRGIGFTATASACRLSAAR